MTRKKVSSLIGRATQSLAAFGERVGNHECRACPIQLGKTKYEVNPSRPDTLHDP
jgi:hypothetical protein